MRDKA